MTKKEWTKKRKQLPNNYVQLTLQKLVSEGITCTYSTVYDIIRGKNKNTLLTVKVWEKVGEVLKEQKTLLKKAIKAKAI